MKIVAGLGSIDDYIKLVEAGADEVFCGFVPYEWNKKYGNLFPLNRREVLFYNIQINSLEDMKILKQMENEYKVKVTIAFNYLYYLEEQHSEILTIIRELMENGFNEYIIADIALIIYLRNKGLKCNIQLSGECSEINSLAIEFLNKLNISRYIFHRKNSIEDMKSCIKNNKIKDLEYEAFILNEKCHYTGAFCSSLHFDEMIHLCKMPYELGGINKVLRINVDNEEEDTNCELKEYLLGQTGCGICALKRLKEIGVTHLKVVGRGNSVENMVKDIKGLKEALRLTNNGDFENIVKEKIFKGRCSKECYYDFL